MIFSKEVVLRLPFFIFKKESISDTYNIIEQVMMILRSKYESFA